MKITFTAFLALLIISCSSDTDAPIKTQEKQDLAFEKQKENFIDALWQNSPGWATYVGNEKYDTVLSIPDKANRDEELTFVSSYLDSLKKFNPLLLSPSNRTDYHLIENQLNKTRWRIEKFKEYQWNPASYNVAGGFAKILGNKKINLEEKSRRIKERLRNVSAYYETAFQNIKNPTLEHTELAIEQSKGTLHYFNKTIRDSLNQANISLHELTSYEALLNKSVVAIEKFIKQLENELLPELNKSGAKQFRIGKELFEEKFAFDIQSAYTAEEVYNKALKRKDEISTEMIKLSKELWPKYFKNKKQPENDQLLVKSLIDKIAENHVHRDSFISAIEQQIPELEAFIREKDIVYLDPTKPLVVRKTPEYMAGVAGASISSPGPYDADGDTYYNVTPLNKYTEKEAESYLKEYNHYILQVLNIHEAIPGHYLQLVYSNQSKSMIKSILGNGAMIEGWAVYTERMMLEEGYGNHEPELWLMYNKWHLRVVCNTILDYSVHVLNMKEEVALNLLINQAYQEETEARGKWKRATLSQVQLCSYFTGYTEIYDFREELKQKKAENFSLKKFHEQFLSYGSAPVKYVRELMIEN
ncbi:MAG: DUF885 domain-containing protein [Bacteroidota bacterium]|nr:DUF885 domain-containing protein [Bacteroidota bacterium]